MSTIIELSTKCKKCNLKNTCMNKRMMACALAEIPQSINAGLNVNVNINSINESVNNNISNNLSKIIESNIRKRGNTWNTCL